MCEFSSLFLWGWNQSDTVKKGAMFWFTEVKRCLQAYLFLCWRQSSNQNTVCLEGPSLEDVISTVSLQRCIHKLITESCPGAHCVVITNFSYGWSSLLFLTAASSIPLSHFNVCFYVGLCCTSCGIWWRWENCTNWGFSGLGRFHQFLDTMRSIIHNQFYLHSWFIDSVRQQCISGEVLSRKAETFSITHMRLERFLGL